MKRNDLNTTPGTTTARATESPGTCSACESQKMPEEVRCRFCGDWLFDLGRCGLCAEIVATRDKRCVACGTSFDRLSTKPYVPPPTQKLRRRLWLVPVVTLFVVLAFIPDAFIMHDASHIFLVLLGGAVFTIVATLGAWSEDNGVVPLNPGLGPGDNGPPPFLPM